jgi:hypothetical protein
MLRRMSALIRLITCDYDNMTLTKVITTLITVVSVVITFVRVKIILRLEITLCV